MGFANPRFRVISIQGGQRENMFSTPQYYKCFMYHIKAVIVPERFYIVTHSYPVPLSIFNTKAKTIYSNLLVLYESKLKRHLGHFSRLCLCQQLFRNKEFCMKTRLRSYFITNNFMALSKIILESSSAKNVKNNYRKTICSFLWAVQFATGWNV